MATKPAKAPHPASQRGNGASTIDRETSIRFAIMFGIILTWAKSREIKDK
jgi:hypothetical protein